MRNNSFGRVRNRALTAIATAASLAANLNCTSPTPTWDSQGNYQGVEEKWDDSKLAAGVMRLAGQPVSLFAGVLPDNNRASIYSLDAEIRSRDRQIQELREGGVAEVNSQTIHGGLSDRELAETLESNPCFYWQYVGNNEETTFSSEANNPLEDFVGGWRTRLITRSPTSEYIMDDSAMTGESELVCDGRVLVSKFRHVHKLSSSIGAIRLEGVSYTTRNDKTGEYETFGSTKGTWPERGVDVYLTRFKQIHAFDDSTGTLEERWSARKYDEFNSQVIGDMFKNRKFEWGEGEKSDGSEHTPLFVSP